MLIPLGFQFEILSMLKQRIVWGGQLGCLYSACDHEGRKNYGVQGQEGAIPDTQQRVNEWQLKEVCKKLVTFLDDFQYFFLLAFLFFVLFCLLHFKIMETVTQKHRQMTRKTAQSCPSNWGQMNAKLPRKCLPPMNFNPRLFKS